MCSKQDFLHKKFANSRLITGKNRMNEIFHCIQISKNFVILNKITRITWNRFAASSSFGHSFTHRFWNRPSIFRRYLYFPDFSDFSKFDFPIFGFSNFPIFRFSNFSIFRFSIFRLFDCTIFRLYDVPDFPILYFAIRVLLYPKLRIPSFIQIWQLKRNWSYIVCT